MVVAEDCPLVSVIIPTYNRAHLISRAIKSVLVQDYTNFEVILIDDGSTDNSKSVIDSIEDGRIRYIRLEKNSGIGAARSKGISLAQGPLTAFIDSDDQWLPGKLSFQVSAFRSFPAVDLLFCNYANINSVEGREGQGFKQTERGLRKLETAALAQNLWLITGSFPEALLAANFIATSSVMCRTEAVREVGSFDVRLSGPEDFELWWRAGVKKKQFAFTDRVFSKRDKNETSISGQSLSFLPRYNNALDTCIETSRKENRPDLIKPLNKSKHLVWRSLLREYALQGKRWLAWNAFWKSLQYGLTTRTFIFIGAALLGPKLLLPLKNLRKM